MAASLKSKIGLKDIRSLGQGESVWDTVVSGFHARRQKSEAVSYVVMYRNAEGRQRWHTIGRHGSPWTPDMARDEAKKILGSVVTGGDPSAEKRAGRRAATVSELCDQYLADAESGRLLTRRKRTKKLSTLATDRGRIERHIKPLLGGMKVGTVTLEDVDSFMHSVAEGRTAGRFHRTKGRAAAHVRGGQGTATRTVGLLGAIFSYAVRKRMRVDNPVRGIERFEDGRRDRRLSDDEYALLGKALGKAETAGVWPPAIAAVRFLALTGWRSGEVLSLTRHEVDLARRTALLVDTKTGRSMRPLPNGACDLIRSMPSTAQNNLVFPASRGSGRMTGFPKFWARIAKLENLPADVTPHTLRHSFASLAGDMGYSEPTIAALVGHKGRTVTSRYVHAADAVLLAAADSVAARTADLLIGREAGVVVDLIARSVTA